MITLENMITVTFTSFENTTFTSFETRHLHDPFTFNSQLSAARISFKWQHDWKDASLLQYLASQSGKLEKLELLLNHGYVFNESFDPKIVPPKM